MAGVQKQAFPFFPSLSRIVIYPRSERKAGSESGNWISAKVLEYGDSIIHSDPPRYPPLAAEEEDWRVKRPGYLYSVPSNSCVTSPFSDYDEWVPSFLLRALQGPSLKLILNSKPISHKPYHQIERTRALIIPWSIGNNFIFCRFYYRPQFHAQNEANVKSFNFPWHAPHVFPFLRSAKSARIAEVQKVGFTFRFISHQRYKI